jgi:SAM-dependent methyltransferase
MSFPHDDKAWADAAEFLRERLAPADRLVAPDPFRWVIPRSQRFRQARTAAPSDFEWTVVHKGQLDAVPREYIAALPKAAVPVFANEVFVVWTTAPRGELPDLSASDHLRAFNANLAALPPEPADEEAPIEGPPGRTTMVRLPEAPLAGPALAVLPRPRRRQPDPRDAGPRPWLSGTGLPGVLRERAFQEEIDRLVEDSLGDAEGEEVLDIGCGGGRLGTLLAAAAGVTGVDTDEAALERARARHSALPQFRFLAMDAARLEFPDASFDTALMLDSVEGMAEPTLALAEAARVLASGGRLMVTAMNRESLPFRAMRRLALPVPGRGYSVAELTGMLRAVGLHVVRSDGILLSPGWALAGVGGAMGPLEEDPEFVEAVRVLGRRAGPEYAMGFALVARKG